MDWLEFFVWIFALFVVAHLADCAKHAAIAFAKRGEKPPASPVSEIPRRRPRLNMSHLEEYGVDEDDD